MQLEVGMVLYCEHRFPPSITKHIIDRVTPKRACVGNVEFNREQENNMFYSRGHSSWDSASWKLEDNDIASRYKRHVLEKKFNRIVLKNLTDDQLVRIIAITNEVK
jgi:hypothetical protein